LVREVLADTRSRKARAGTRLPDFGEARSRSASETRPCEKLGEAERQTRVGSAGSRDAREKQEKNRISFEKDLAPGWGFTQARAVLGLHWPRSFVLALAVSGSASAVEEPRVAFRFLASSTLFARPGVGRDGSVYVGSGDGYVHALMPDGSFRWSYTVKGRVIAPPVEEPGSGRVFVATSEARLYALEPDSQLRWVFPLPVAPKSELALTPKGTLLFVGQDDYLYGVTTGGALSLRLAAKGARSAPTQLASGQTALVLGEALATLKGYGYERATLPGPFGASAKLAVATDGAVSACEDGKASVISDGQREFEAKTDCLSPPTRGQGFFAVAEAGGGVRLFHGDGRTTQVSLDTAPLRPIWDAERKRLVVSSATGSVTVLELPGGPL
jgi:hypothetical protein